MCRGVVLLFLPLPLLGAVLVAEAEPDRATLLKQAQALQTLVQTTIREAGPSVACILVSRSAAYQRYGERPSAEYPGQLGGFDAAVLASLSLSRAERARLHRQLDLTDPAHVPEVFGSGVVLDARGLVLTNYHVVQGATKIVVRLPGLAGCYADIHAADPRSDLAVLRLLGPAAKGRPLPLGDSTKAERGQFVVVLTNPFSAAPSDGQPSAALGVIRSVRQPAAGLAEEQRGRALHSYRTLLETDVPLHPGASGGPVLNLKGELVGLLNGLAAVQGGDAPTSFAVAMDPCLRAIIEVLKRGEEVEYGFLGVTFDRKARSDKGVVLGRVTAGSPADRKGLHPRDVILAVNGAPMRTGDDLFYALGALLAGARVTLDVQKAKAHQPVRVEVVLAKAAVLGKKIASSLAPRPYFRGLRVDHTSLLAQKEPRSLDPQRIPLGVLVSEVRGDSSAATALLRPGDVITHVNGRPVDNPAAFYQEVAGLSGAVELTLAGARPGQPAPKVVLN